MSETAMQQRAIASLKPIEKRCDDLWVLLVKLRDGKCRRCGSVWNLESHHHIGRKATPTRYLLDNGAATCEPCHRILTANKDERDIYLVLCVGGKRADELTALANTTQLRTIDFLEQTLAALKWAQETTAAQL